MNIKNITAGVITALSLVSAPVMAQSIQASQPTKAVAATVERGSAKSDSKSKLTGNAIIPLVLAAAIIAGGVYLIADDNNNNNDRPTSP